MLRKLRLLYDGVSGAMFRVLTTFLFFPHIPPSPATNLPPCSMWEQAEDGTTWMQYVSKVPASREEVRSLESALDQRLAQRQAKLTGLCPVREDLYKQAFGEHTSDARERTRVQTRKRDGMGWIEGRETS